MEISAFRSAAMASAEMYYRFLDENGKGRITTRIQRIEPKTDGILLKMATRFSPGGSMESLIFDLSGQEYTAHQFNPVSYDAQAATLFLQPNSQTLFERIASAAPADLAIHSDLKFLVRRVHDWYKEYGTLLDLPHTAPGIQPPSKYFGARPTRQQQEAICGALSNPLSYVWGAPGTGKTRCVLANCVIAYLLEKKRVSLVAPTNNAVDQMLYGLMPILQEAGFTADRVLRLGIPSAKFAAMYPDACETAGIGQQMARIDRQSLLYSDCLSLRQEARRIAHAKETLTDLIDQALALRQRQDKLSADLQKNDEDLVMLRTKKTLLSREAEQLLQQIEEELQYSHTLRCRFTDVVFPATGQKRRQHLEQLYQSLAASQAAQDKIDPLLCSAEELALQLSTAQKSTRAELYALQERLIHTMECSPSLVKAVRQVSLLSPNPDCGSLFDAIHAVADLNAQRLERFASYADISDDELQGRLDALRRERAALEQTDREKYKGKYVIAATIDRYISTFVPEKDSDKSKRKTKDEGEDNEKFKPEHIFMDEAGYCCLVKGATLLSHHVPITLLGDHMQLPPVCEMNDIFLKDAPNVPVFLWSQSSLFFEDIFRIDLRQMLDRYLKNAAPFLLHLSKFDLTRTHRFGDAISSVLSRTVYSPDFHSANPDGTSILVLDAPRTEGGKRQSVSEASVIEQYLHTAEAQDYAILTPYRNQVSLLSQRLKAAAREGRVLTVHASQGREWDTLIFSPVDNSPGTLWFSDSLSFKSRGKEVINTAISRAKKRLVIVCDCAFWRSDQRQLITQLILSGQMLHTDDPPPA